MKIEKNDPRLTAYILNELPLNEMNLIKEEIKKNPELQEELTRLSQSVLQFKKIKTDETLRLSPAQREKIFSEIAPRSAWSKFYKFAGGLAVASLAIVIFIKNESDLRSAARKESDMTIDSGQYSKKERSKAPQNVAETPAKHLPTASNSKPIEKPSAPKPSEMAKAKEASDGFAPPSQALLGSGGASAAEISMAPAEFSDSAESEAPAGKPAAKLALNASRSKGYPDSYGAQKRSAINKTTDQAQIAEQKIEENYIFQIQSLDESPESNVVGKILTKPLFSCLENSLNRYTNYELEVILSWIQHKSDVQKFTIKSVRSEGPQNFGTELKCLEPKLKQEFVTNPALANFNKEFKYRLILRSK